MRITKDAIMLLAALGIFAFLIYRSRQQVATTLRSAANNLSPDSLPSDLFNPVKTTITTDDIIAKGGS